MSGVAIGADGSFPYSGCHSSRMDTILAALIFAGMAAKTSRVELDTGISPISSRKWWVRVIPYCGMALDTSISIFSMDRAVIILWIYV